jgi:hypothetical protein
MQKLFANKNKLVPPKEDQENGLLPLDSITGTLISTDIRRGKSASRFWLVLKIKRDYNYVDVFFDALNASDMDIDRYNLLRGKAVTVKSVNEIPEIEPVGIESEENIRAILLKGVAAGNIKMEDIPALLKFANGEDVPFEMWDLLKQQIENERLAKVKEDVAKEADSLKEAIEHEKDRLHQLRKLLSEVNAEKERMLQELYSALMFLQGNDHLEGSQFGFSAAASSQSENLVSIGKGYNELIAAFEKFRTKKGVYVVCEDKLHLIHDAYLEKGGRAFLLGDSKEYLRTKPEEVRKLIDKLMDLYSVYRSVK